LQGVGGRKIFLLASMPGKVEGIDGISRELLPAN